MNSSNRSLLKRLRTSAARAGTRLLEFCLGNALLLSLLTLAVVLIVLFFVGLGRLAPSSPGQQLPLSTVVSLIDQGRVARAVLRDEDSRIDLTTVRGLQIWATYPQDSYTNELLAT